MDLRAILHDRFHAQRAARFLAVMRPAAGATVLDLGGHHGHFVARIAAQAPLVITVADIDPGHRAPVEARGYAYTLIPETGRLPFATQHFDIVLCNSVIEHVTGPKAQCRLDRHVPRAEWSRTTREAQRTFAAEIRRVGRRYFVQTPHPAFPVCQHLMLPFTHWLPRDAQRRIATWSAACRYSSASGVVDWRLLSPRLVHALFPEARLAIERVAGLPKSIIAYSAERWD